MRLLRFFANDGRVHLGVRRGDVVHDMGERSPLDAPGESEIAAAPTMPASGLKLDAPLRDVRKLLALAGNYRKHIEEGGFTAPAEQAIITPQVFWKPPTTINAPGGTIAVRPANVFLDWEVELAVVMGKAGQVFGYTVINDISERKFNARLENRNKREYDPFFDWLNGKWFDGSAPLGPEIVTADEIPDPYNLGIRLFLNGEMMQNSNTGYMIFRIPEVVAYLSSILTLEPGDVIAMGTPEGIGLARGRALRPGDVMRAEIDGIGALETTVVEEAAR
jgi:2-keto-4-pentenoate hydratase/2-oxohepta-3-ene-1,7-dioic acid hydratase in catechol pathway